MSAQEIARSLGGASRGANGWWQAKCPAHDDGKASLGLHDAEDGGVAWKCLAGCDSKAVADALKAKGLLNGRVSGAERKGKGKGKDKTKAKLGIVDKIYDYVDAKGEVAFQVQRYRPKAFRQRRPDPNKPGQYINSVSDLVRPLYQLPALVAADPDADVFLVEGEKDVDRLRSIGLVATTTAQGAEGWPKSDHTPLAGRHVVLMPDNDDAGGLYAGMAGRDLLGRAASVRLLQLPDLPPKGDVSDWLDAGGTVEELRRLAASAPAYEAQDDVAPEEWLEPEELREGDEPQPFPLAALPPKARAAVVEFQAYGKQPVEMVAASALAAMSGAVQGLVDVRRDSQLVGPVSINTVVIANSGERKTGCDNAFTAAAERWARAEAKRIEPLRAAARGEREAHEAEKQKLLSEMRSVRTRGKKAKGDAKVNSEADIEELRTQLRDHGKKLPILPPLPSPRVEDGTAVGVAKILLYSWPSVVWGSSEGAVVTAGHAFRDDSLLGSLAFLNARWDGAPIDRARSVEDYVRVYGRRASVSLMLQPAAFTAFAKAGDGAARGLGNLARALLTWPASTMGTRFRDADAPDTELPALGAFLTRAEALYATPLPMPFDIATMEPGTDDDDAPLADQLELRPAELTLTPESRRLWIDYLNECEAQLAPEGDFADVKDIAAKSAENACRLAGIFHVWETHPFGAIGADNMERGVKIARWFLCEARRVLGTSADQAVAGDAELLARWVHSCPSPPTLKDAAQLAPYRLRDKPRRDAAVAYLEKRYWLRQEKRLKSTVLVLNPKLPWEA